MKTHPLRAFREREQLSQRQLAELLGTNRENVTRWENGTRMLPVERVPGIARKTGIKPRDLRPDLAELWGIA